MNRVEQAVTMYVLLRRNISVTTDRYAQLFFDAKL